MSRGLDPNVVVRRQAIYVCTALAILCLFPWARSSSWHGTNQLHTLIELTTTLLAIIVGALALLRFYSRKFNVILFIATGFLGAGLLDGYHALVSSPAFRQFFPSPPPSLIPWSGFSSRIFLAVLLWLSWIFFRRENRLGEASGVREKLVYLIVGSWLLLCFAFFALVPLPLAYKQLPLFHRPQELVPVFFFVMALAGYLREARWKAGPSEHWLIVSLIFCVAQSAFMAMSDRLYDSVYIVSHALKILAYISVLVGLFTSVYYLFVREENVVAERTQKLRQEIAERKRAEDTSLALLRREQLALEKICEERTFADTLIESLPMLFAAFDMNGRCLRWNKNFEKVLGHSAARIPYIHILDTIAEPYRDFIQQKIQEAFETGFSSAEAALLTTHGIVPYFFSSVRILLDGKPCVAGMALDISKRKQAEEQLVLQSAALHSAANAIVITNSEGVIQWVNPAFTQLTGYSLEEAVGQNPRILKSGEQGQSFYHELWSTILAGKVWKSELTNRRKDGRLYAEEMTIAPVRSATGKISNFVAIKQDVTERKIAQAQLARAKETAEAANRAKSEFLANMSHELRTPLNGIMGMTELVLQTELLPEQREYLTMSKASADVLLALINDILDFSKIEAGKLEFETIDFTFRATLEACLKALAPRAHEKGLELNFLASDEIPAVLAGDPSRLRQIIVNIVGNAIKFTEQGEVTLEVKQESADAQTVVLHFQVTDTGIGIPEDRREEIFDAFAQADGSTTRRYGGSGLGLTISRRLVEMFGGQLWFQSVLGQGSTFHFTVRLSRETEAACDSILPAADLEGISVLVAEDNATNRRILQAMLVGWRMQPTLVNDARTALHHLHAAEAAGKPFRLLITDSQMPDMDGFMLIKKIKQDAHLRVPNIIVLTSAVQSGDAARCRQLGVAAYLTKPVGSTELLTAIHQVLGRKIVQPASEPRLTPPPRAGQPEKKLRILLAEDNLVNRLVAVRLLEKQGHSVEVAEDGHEAVIKAKPGCFDLVLMDVQMPVMDGFAATRAIREAEKSSGGHLHIIAMTAHALKGDRERCLATGMDGYISKPFKLDELLAEIEKTPELQTAPC